MQLQDTLQAFISYQENRERHRRITIEHYGEYLKKWYNYLAQKYHIKEIDMTTLVLSDISDFALTLKEGRKRKTVNCYLAAIKCFLKRCYKHNNYTTLKYDQIEFMKQESYKAEILTDTELQELFSMPAICEATEIIALRNELLLKMLYCTGMRISEIINLETNMIEQQFTITGKGGYERTVFLTPEVYDLVDSYNYMKEEATHNLFVAHNTDGSVKHDKPLRKETPEKMIKKYREVMGSTKKITPHTLRHTFASNLVMRGADLIQIQKLLGHKSITSTEIYLHVHNKHLLQTHTLLWDSMPQRSSAL